MSSSSSVGPLSASRLISFSITPTVWPRSARVWVPPTNSAVIERQQVGIDRIGEAALLAHFLVEPRGERAAAQDVIDDEGGDEVGVLARNAGAAESHHRLRHVEFDVERRPRPYGDVRNRLQFRLRRQSHRIPGRAPPTVLASMSPTTPTFRLSARQHATRIGVEYPRWIVGTDSIVPLVGRP